MLFSAQLTDASGAELRIDFDGPRGVVDAFAREHDDDDTTTTTNKKKKQDDRSKGEHKENSNAGEDEGAGGERKESGLGSTSVGVGVGDSEHDGDGGQIVYQLRFVAPFAGVGAAASASSSTAASPRIVAGMRLEELGQGRMVSLVLEAVATERKRKQ